MFQSRDTQDTKESKDKIRFVIDKNSANFSSLYIKDYMSSYFSKIQSRLIKDFVNDLQMVFLAIDTGSDTRLMVSKVLEWSKSLSKGN